MLSRDAEACFWIGRYVERAEATARMVDVHYHASLETTNKAPRLDEEGNVHPMNWNSLLAISGAQDAFYDRYTLDSDRNVLHFLAFDMENRNSIFKCWRAARENARSIREQIASEMWESLNISYMQFQEWDVERVMAGSPHEFFQMVKNSSHLLQGILNRTMIMGEARDWLDTGRFLERAGQTARLLDVKYHDLLPVHDPGSTEPLLVESSRGLPHPYGVGGPLDIHGWIAILKSVSAFEMYRKTHRSGITPANVVDFLVLNKNFPASVKHGIKRVEGCLKRISANESENPKSYPERVIGKLNAELTYAQPDEIISNGLHEFLEDVQLRCTAVGSAITETYLSF